MDKNQVETIENLTQWKDTFEKGWLANYWENADIDWHTYRPPINRNPVAGKGIKLASARLMLVSSAGAYLPDTQQPFDAANPLGDYTIRKLTADVELHSLAYAHDHYDHHAVEADPQVLVPLDHLKSMAADGMIGGLTGITSFMGYQPDVSRVVEETLPAILEHAHEERADSVLLVPS